MSRRNWAFDIVLAVAVGLLGQLEAWWGIGSTHRQGPLWAQSLLYAATALLLVGRRVRPLACLAAIATVSVVEFASVGSPEGFAVSLAPLIATYTVGNRLDWRRSWLGLLLAVLLWVLWAGFDPLNQDLGDRLGSMVWLTPAIIGGCWARWSGPRGSTPSSGASTVSSGRRVRWPRSATGSPASCTTSSATASAS